MKKLSPLPFIHHSSLQIRFKLFCILIQCCPFVYRLIKMHTNTKSNWGHDVCKECSGGENLYILFFIYPDLFNQDLYICSNMLCNKFSLRTLPTLSCTKTHKQSCLKLQTRFHLSFTHIFANIFNIF